jgi:glycerate kinase
MLCAHTRQPDSLMDEPGAGAAGGFAFGLMAGAGARLVPGFDLVADWLDLDRRLAAADLVITGEGRYDATSAAGKGPGAVVARAHAAGRPVHVFAGSVASPQPQVHAISPTDWPLERAIAETRTQLRAALQQPFA